MYTWGCFWEVGAGDSRLYSRDIRKREEEVVLCMVVWVFLIFSTYSGMGLGIQHDIIEEKILWRNNT